MIRFLALSCALLLAGSAAADVLELRDGRVIHGKYVGGTQNNIRFMVDNELKYFPVKDVVTITFEDSTEGASATPPTTPPAKATAPAAAPATAPATAPAKPTAAAPAKSVAAPQSVTVPAGTRLLVRMIDGVDSETNKVGDRFRASLEEDLVVDNVVVAPKGSDVNGRLSEAKEAGKLTGKSQLRLELTDIVIGGKTYTIESGDYEVSGKSRGGDTAKKVGIGTAVGAVVGAIAGGGKGAAIGAGVGAGAGTAIQVLTKGEQVRVPSETMLEFALEQPLTVRVSPPSAQ